MFTNTVFCLCFVYPLAYNRALSLFNMTANFERKKVFYMLFTGD